MLAVFLFVLAFIVQLFASNIEFEFLTLSIGITILFSFLLAIYGAINTLQGFKEESSKEQIIGLIVSSIFLMIITYTTIMVCQEI